VAAFGVVGLFVGPVLLAVAAALLESWMADADQDTAAAASGPGTP
jgi:predicted PurR-regulated permease PerM